MGDQGGCFFCVGLILIAIGLFVVFNFLLVILGVVFMVGGICTMQKKKQQATTQTEVVSEPIQQPSEPVPEIKAQFCPQCGSKEDSEYCSACGYKIE